MCRCFGTELSNKNHTRYTNYHILYAISLLSSAADFFFPDGHDVFNYKYKLAIDNHFHTELIEMFLPNAHTLFHMCPNGKGIKA